MHIQFKSIQSEDLLISLKFFFIKIYLEPGFSFHKSRRKWDQEQEHDEEQEEQDQEQEQEQGQEHNQPLLFHKH